MRLATESLRDVGDDISGSILDVKPSMDFCCNNQHSWTWSRRTTPTPTPLPNGADFLRKNLATQQRLQRRRRTKTPTTTTSITTTTTTSAAAAQRRRKTNSLASRSASRTSETLPASSLSSVVLYPLASLLALLRASTLRLIMTISLLSIQQFSFNDASNVNVLKLATHLASAMVKAVRQAWAIFLLASLLHQTVVVDGAKGGFRDQYYRNIFALTLSNYVFIFTGQLVVQSQK